MIDHLTLRVPDLAPMAAAFGAMLGELEIEQTTSRPTMAAWGNFALAQERPDRPSARLTHIAFVAPTPGHVDRFAAAGLSAGLADNGPAGPRPGYGPDYYCAFLLDNAGNNYEAVHHDGERPAGAIDHVGLRVADPAVAGAFYRAIGPAAGLSIRREDEDRTSFWIAGGSFIALIAGAPSEFVHIAFDGSEENVRRFHADAVAAGYRSNGEPGERTEYHDGYYAAFVLDPDGSNIEVVNHQHR